MEAKLLLMVPFTYSAFACKSHQYCLSQTLLILARAILLYKMHLRDMGCICHRHLIYVLLRECTPVKNVSFDHLVMSVTYCNGIALGIYFPYMNACAVCD